MRPIYGSHDISHNEQYFLVKSLQIKTLSFAKQILCIIIFVIEIEDSFSFSVTQNLSQPIEHCIRGTFNSWAMAAFSYLFELVWGCYSLKRIDFLLLIVLDIAGAPGSCKVTLLFWLTCRLTHLIGDSVAIVESPLLPSGCVAQYIRCASKDWQ